MAFNGSLRAAAVRLHNQNMTSTVDNPNDSHPNRKICSQCIFFNSFAMRGSIDW